MCLLGGFESYLLQCTGSQVEEWFRTVGNGEGDWFQLLQCRALSSNTSSDAHGQGNGSSEDLQILMQPIPHNNWQAFISGWLQATTSTCCARNIDHYVVSMMR